MPNKINVIVDSNIIFYRIIYRLAPRGNKLTTDNYIKQFLNEVHQELMEILIPLQPYTKRLIFVRDHKMSWRASLDDDSVDYKGNRKDRELKFSMEGFFKAFDAYFKLLDQKGFYNVCTEYAEGDDLLYAISQVLYNNGESSVLVSKDKDIPQLIKGDWSKFVCVFNDETKTFYHDHHMIDNSDDMESLLSGASSVLSVINSRFMIRDPQKVLTVKLLSGDDSDNVPSSFKYKVGTGREFSFTELRADAFYEKNMACSHAFLKGEMAMDAFVRVVVDHCVASKLFSKENNQGIEESIKHGIERNRKFIWINEAMYPQFFKDKVFAHLSRLLTSKEKYESNKNAIPYFKKLFEETEWYSHNTDYTTFEQFNKLNGGEGQIF